MPQNQNYPTFQMPDREEQESWLFKVILLPKYLGEFIFTLIGNNEALETSKFILGYMVLLGVVLLVIGFFSSEMLTTLLQHLFTQ